MWYHVLPDGDVITVSIEYVQEHIDKLTSGEIHYVPIEVIRHIKDWADEV